MTASRNVFGNVFEYDANGDVFGNVFEWQLLIPDIADGWSFEYETSVFVCEAEDQAFTFEES